MLRLPTGDSWLGVCREPLPVVDAQAWATVASCGAVVTFTGTVRDHAPGRDGVTALDYEAYEEEVVPGLQAIADDVRLKWPTVGRIAMLHRVGHLEVTDVAVVAVVSAAHRDEAFDAVRYCIDTLKATAPIWKKETWADGEAWAATP
ncbi:MAG TPA: molybdenum cofactor biosynthesis protein MoaE [Acidimicrobiales bacterium]|nr:molybdenum cofactor biosynthesis protein MoaE [Acidimicrobiales bacterium]